MSRYTDARSRPGAKGAADTNDRTTFLTEFGGIVLLSYDEAMNYGDMRFVKNVTQGQADTFPTIGRKRDAQEHNPGELILGGTMNHDQVTITLDNILVDSIFSAEIDQLMTHYNYMEAYAKQIGQSLGVTNDKRIAIMHILASRGATINADGIPAPAYYWAADLKTNPAKLEEAAFLSVQYLKENDISGDAQKFMLPHQQILLMARYTGTESGVTSGSGNRSSGTMGPVAGLTPQGTNHIPKTQITTGLPKYRGDFRTTVGHIGTRMAVGTLERRGLKMVMKDQEDRLGTIIIGSMFNGHGTLRNECSIELRTDAIAGRTALNG